MDILGRFKRAFSGPRRPPSRARRSYNAAMVDRLTADWTTINKTAKAELRYALKSLRARSRELARNNDYARKFLKMVGSNVVGPQGIKLQVRARDDNGKLDGFANDLIEKHFMRWGRPGSCTVDGKLGWMDAQRLFIESVARDGEVLVRKVRGRAARNDYGFALQFIEADHLDEGLNDTLRNGNRIEMGIEFNAWKRPVAFHILDKHPGSDTYSVGGRTYSRVPAADIYHPFIMERAGQPRGVPWMASAMLHLQMIGGYEEAELVAARIGASKMGFFTSPDADGYAGDEDDDGNLTMEAEPGLFEQLPSGLSVETFDPNHPNSQYSAFIKAALRGVASGIGVSYNALASDLEGVNYSSIRQGALDERDLWRVLQWWDINHFCAPVFEDWLLAFLTTRLSSLPPRKFDKFNAPVWSPRGWQWIDPLKEVKANIEAVNAGFKSRTDVLAEQGRDFEETLEQLAAEQELSDEHGLQLSEGSSNENENENENENDQDAEADKNGDD